MNESQEEAKLAVADDQHVHNTFPPSKSTANGSKPQFRVLSTYTPLPFVHPTHATLQDTDTGEIYEWNSRAHRKLRDLPNQDASKNAHHFARLWCYEPHIVTWWLNITNLIANAFWTLSGAYATWPSSDADASGKIVYAAGIIACVFMVVSCYLSYVEAINQSNVAVNLPDQSSVVERRRKRRRFVRSTRVYGKYLSPIGFDSRGVNSRRHHRWMRKMGYPAIENVDTGKIVAVDKFGTLASDPSVSSADEEEGEGDHDASLQSFIGKDYNIRLGHFVVTTKLLKLSRMKEREKSYEWWTLHPSLDQVAVVLALIGLFSAVVYLIPMCAGWPLAQNGNASVGVTIFFVDVLQVIPYICFVLCGHVYIAEAAGSWWKPKLNSIGYYACVFNTIGAWGFLLCGALAIPVTLGSDCCPNIAKWGASFACFWGSVSYVIGGVIQWIEFANPEPIVFGNKKREH